MKKGEKWSLDCRHPLLPPISQKPRNTRLYLFFLLKKNGEKHARIRQKTQEDICYSALGGGLIPLIENWGETKAV